MKVIRDHQQEQPNPTTITTTNNFENQNIRSKVKDGHTLKKILTKCISSFVRGRFKISFIIKSKNIYRKKNIYQMIWFTMHQAMRQ